MVPHHHVPGNAAGESGCLKRHLVAYAVRTRMRARTRRDEFTVHHIDEPARFIIGAVVAGISECDPEIEGITAVQVVHCLNGGIQNLCGI